jgi:predicted ester cyclase
MDLVIDDEIAEADRVVHRWTWHLKHTGDFSGIPASGREATITGMTVVRLSAGLIVEHWAIVDSLSLMQQLGAIPSAADSG